MNSLALRYVDHAPAGEALEQQVVRKEYDAAMARALRILSGEEPP